MRYLSVIQQPVLQDLALSNDQSPHITSSWHQTSNRGPGIASTLAKLEIEL